MLCNQCGAPIPNGAERCGSCGAAIVPTGTGPSLEPRPPGTGRHASTPAIDARPPLAGQAGAGRRTAFRVVGIALVVVAALSFILQAVGYISGALYQAGPGGAAPFSTAAFSPFLNALFVVVLVACGILMFGEAGRAKGAGMKGGWAVTCGVADLCLAFSQLIGIISTLLVSTTLAILIDTYGMSASEIVFLQSVINLAALFFTALPGVLYIVSGVLGKRAGRTGSVLVVAGVLFVVGPLMGVAVLMGFSYLQDMMWLFILNIPLAALAFASWTLRGYTLIKLS